VRASISTVGFFTAGFLEARAFFRPAAAGFFFFADFFLRVGFFLDSFFGAFFAGVFFFFFAFFLVAIGAVYHQPGLAANWRNGSSILALRYCGV